MPRRPRAATPPPGPASRALALARACAVVAVFTAVGLWQAAPAFEGAFLSDDLLYIKNNLYVQDLSLENVRAILDPWGSPTVYTLNYAPVHLLAHALEWRFFGEQGMTGWHVVNALAHVLASLLLLPLLRRSGLPVPVALLGAAFFLVHPANAEVVGWIFQLKTSLSLALSVGALLLHERRPAWGALLFALALLTKIQAVGMLPAAALLAWARAKDGVPPRWGWLAVWALVFLAIAVPEMTAFQRQADERLVIHEDPLVHARTIVAIAARYLAMAATSYGVATFHEPAPAVSWLDPWWLAGLAALGLLGWRTLAALRRRDEEAGYWVMALAAFAPVSQIFPFIFPMGDRYLYPILPGLLGGTLLALRPLARRVQALARQRLGADAPLARRAAIAAALVGLAALAVRSERRAPVFVSMESMMMDAALRYPDGMQASLLRGQRAAQLRDGAGAARAFQRAIDLGFSDLAMLVNSSALDPVRGHPEVEAMLRGLAARDIRKLEGAAELDQSEVIQLAIAYVMTDRPADAIHILERGLTQEGPLDEVIEEQLRLLRRLHPGAAGAATGPPDPRG